MSLASDYAARMTGEGETLSADGTTAITELETVNTAQSVTLLHGWLAGSKMNLSTGEMLDLVGAADFVKSGTATYYVGEGTLALESDTGASYLDTSTQIFTNDDWSCLFMVDKPSRDMTFPSDESSFLISQYGGFANGHLSVSGEFNESVVLTWLGSSDTINLKGASPACRPVVVWLTYVHSTRTLTAYDPFTGDTLGSSVGVDLGSGNAWATATLRVSGDAVSTRLIQFGGLFKFSGSLNSTKRNALFAVYYDVMTRFANNALIYGNSVTNGADATQFDQSWVGLFHVWAAKNNAYIWMPANMGGKSLWHYRPSDFALSAERATAVGTLPDRLLTAVVENYIDKRINVLICDENQNTAAGGGVANGEAVIYADYVSLREAIADKLRPGVTAAKTLKVVQCTMIAPWAIDSVTFDPLTYADVHASVWRGKLCSMSADVRVDPTVDEYFELYGGSNLGWGVSDDGDAEDPETDEANGDPTLYVDDPQHFSNAGHLLEFGLVRDAFLEAVAIPPTINLRGFSLPLAQPAY